MTYLVSLLMGVAIGVVYGFVQVRSPAPPLIALVGLLGMVLGEHAGNAGHHYIKPTSGVAEQTGGEIEHLLVPVSNSMTDAKHEGR
jgi:XapX domain-containing protein